MNSKEADEAVRALKWVSYGKPGHEEYKAAQRKIEADWRAYLEDEYGWDIPPTVYGELFRRAWSDGHHAGYYEVESYYGEYADFARRVVEAVE